jgi:cephalosporin-C deacetylase-like acetyl esterase
MQIFRYIHLVLLFSFLFICCNQEERINPPAEIPEEIPWDFKKLSSPPSFEWKDTTDAIWSLHYEGELFSNKKTQVFAYYASPATLGDISNQREFPGMVLVHGGGGTAFKFWVHKWAKKGYAAIAMDLNGSEPVLHNGDVKRERMPNGAPPQKDRYRIHNIDSSFYQQWQFHAVSNILRAHSILRSFQEVDRNKTAITGVSWGGYLTNIIAGIDNRFNAAVPVYGSGFIQEGSFWTDRSLFDTLTNRQMKKWIRYWDPANYVKHATMPMLFINGTNDKYYHLGIFAKTYELVENRKLHIDVNLEHGHKQGTKPEEIYAFVNHHLCGNMPLSTVSKPEVIGDSIVANIDSDTKIRQGMLYFTLDNKHNTKREWSSVVCDYCGNSVRAKIPSGEIKIYYINVTDARGYTVSSDPVFTPSFSKK